MIRYILMHALPFENMWPVDSGTDADPVVSYDTRGEALAAAATMGLERREIEVLAIDLGG